AGEQGADMRAWRHAQHHVDIAQRKVGVEYAHAVPQTGERRREVDGDARLAHAALAAGNDHPRTAAASTSGQTHDTLSCVSGRSQSTASASSDGVAQSRSSGT